MKTVNEIAKLTGISKRTIRYYDQIGLLTPAEINESGYRLYDDESLKTLRQILFFKELDFSLKDIKSIINSENFNEKIALEKHKKLLLLKIDNLNNIVNIINKILKGEDNMEFNEFDMSDIQKSQIKYSDEVKKLWGNTDAYKESQRKTSNYSNKDWDRINEDIQGIFKKFAENMDKKIDSKEVQNLVSEWQNCITENFYYCTNEILRGLGKMYVSDQRFTDNINKYKDGLSLFINNAIEYYCDNN